MNITEIRFISVLLKLSYSYTGKGAHCVIPLKLSVIYRNSCSQGFAWQTGVLKYKGKKKKISTALLRGNTTNFLWIHLVLSRTETIAWNMLSSAPPLHILYFTGPSKHLKNSGLFSLCSPATTVPHSFCYIWLATCHGRTRSCPIT